MTLHEQGISLRRFFNSIYFPRALHVYAITDFLSSSGKKDRLPLFCNLQLQVRTLIPFSKLLKLKRNRVATAFALAAKKGHLITL